VAGDEPSASTAIKASSLATQVYETLRRRITEGRLPEDEPLVIASLVRELGVSQTPVREALARLHAEGLAAFAENLGYRVATRPSDADYRNWMEARLLLEVNSLRAAAAAAAATDERIARLCAVNAEIAAADFGSSFEGIRRFAELNAAFHRELILMGGNPFLVGAYDQIWLGAQFSRIHFKRGVTDQRRIAREHQAIIDALRARDVDRACEAMRSHIVDSLVRDQEREERAAAGEDGEETRRGVPSSRSGKAAGRERKKVGRP